MHYPAVSSIKIPKSIYRKIKSEAMFFYKNSKDYDHPLVNGKAKIVPLVTPGGGLNRLSNFTRGEDFKQTTLLARCPEIANLLDSLPGKKFSCRLSILEKETEILPHRDYFRSLEFGVIRLHLPIETSKSIFFNIDNEDFFLPPVQLHFVDISKLHYIKNNTKKKRIHLIIDLEVTSHLLGMLNFPLNLEEFRYLDISSRIKTEPLRECIFNIKPENLPYPLSIAKTPWKIKSTRNRWNLVTKGYSFKISQNTQGFFYLDVIGPGFRFYFTNHYLKSICSGVIMLGAKGITNGTLKSTQKIIKAIE